MSIKELAGEYMRDIINESREQQAVPLTVRMQPEVRDRIQRLSHEVGKSQSTVAADLLNAASLELAEQLAKQAHSDDHARVAMYWELAFGEELPEVSSAHA